MWRKWIIRDGIVTVQGDKENLTCLEKICRLDGKMRKYYEMIQQALDEFTKNLIVDDYEEGHEYDKGDYCLYDDTLWLCIESHTASDFDPSKWQKVTLTDVLKILTDNLYTTIETVNTTVQSVITTIYTVQGLIGTVTDQGNSIGNLNGRVTALETSSSLNKTVVLEATLSNDDQYSYKNLVLTNATIGDIRTACLSGKSVFIHAPYNDGNRDLMFRITEVSPNANSTISAMCLAEADDGAAWLFHTKPGTPADTSSTLYVYTHYIDFVT